jgi:hypothetical protein
MLVEQLLADPTAVGHAPEMDALTESDALQEAQLIDIRVNALTSTVGLLFDLRMALQLRTANTAIVVGRAVHEFSWSAERRATARTAWNVVGSEPGWDDLFSLSLSFIPSARARLVCERAEFYVGEVAGLYPTPPDYGREDDGQIAAAVAAWTSTFEPVHATVFELDAQT